MCYCEAIMILNYGVYVHIQKRINFLLSVRTKCLPYGMFKQEKSNSLLKQKKQLNLCILAQMGKILHLAVKAVLSIFTMLFHLKRNSLKKKGKTQLLALNTLLMV